MSSDDTALWLFADQLSPAVYGGEHAHREVLLVEAHSALAKRRYHRQKLHIVLSTLRHAHKDLGERATLIKASTYGDALAQFNRPVLVHEPTSHTAEEFVHKLHDKGLVEGILPTPTFALPRKHFETWAACPFTAGYWAFTHRHQDMLSKNNRTQRAVSSMNRLADLDAVLEQEAARRDF